MREEEVEATREEEVGRTRREELEENDPGEKRGSGPTVATSAPAVHRLLLCRQAHTPAPSRTSPGPQPARVRPYPNRLARRHGGCARVGGLGGQPLLPRQEIEKAVDKIQGNVLKVEWDFEGIHYFDNGPLTVQYLFVLDALTFCFWPEKCTTEEAVAVGHGGVGAAVSGSNPARASPHNQSLEERKRLAIVNHSEESRHLLLLHVPTHVHRLGDGPRAYKDVAFKPTIHLVQFRVF